MEKSNLQIARAAYQPKLPQALLGPVKAVEGAPTQSVGNQEEIKALFPNTYGINSFLLSMSASSFRVDRLLVDTM